MQLLNATDGKRVGQIKRLYRAAFPRSERKPFEVILDKTKSGQMDLLAVEQDGFCGLVITILHRDIVLLDYFAITPKRRGQGIGTQMVLEAHALAKAFGCTDMQLGVYPQNDDAVGFYQKCGFTIRSIDMQRKV